MTVRVLVVGPEEPDAFADNVADSLLRMGHDVRSAGAARRAPRGRRTRNATYLAAEQIRRLDVALQQHLVDAAEEFRPDLVLTIDSRIRPAVVEDLQKHAAAVALWFPDHVANMGRHEMFLAPYDRIYLKNRAVVRQLAELHGLRVEYLPEAANPSWHKPVCEYGEDPVIVMAGNVHPTRAVLLERLVRAKIPVALYGPPISGWVGHHDLAAVHRGRSVFREEKAKAFRSARAVLNNLHPAEFSGSNCRLFEATACGAVALTEWRSEMADLFERDREVVAFETFDDLIDRCRWLLESPENGRPIADAAAARSARDHIYDLRLEAMFVDLGFGPSGSGSRSTG